MVSLLSRVVSVVYKKVSTNPLGSSTPTAPLEINASVLSNRCIHLGHFDVVLVAAELAGFVHWLRFVLL